jgi:hypothetical protein
VAASNGGHFPSSGFMKCPQPQLVNSHKLRWGEITLRLMVSQSVCLGIEHPCGTCDQIFLPVGTLLFEICGTVSVGRPLWQEDVSAICNVINQWSESRRTRTILYLLIWDSPNLENQVPIFISLRNTVAQLLLDPAWTAQKTAPQ